MIAFKNISLFFFLLVTVSAVRIKKPFITKPKMISSSSDATSIFDRPCFVREALLNDNSKNQNYIYYFGLGSNMLRSKIENRGMNGTKIDILEMEPGFVKGHRLSFNLRGFAPLEPGMGSLEPVDSDSIPVCAYDQPECHGALIKLTPENYEKVMQSEGISPNATIPGYEEVVVTVIPYDPNKEPVQAVALRARSHVRLQTDACPSERYMNLLKQGAAELNLKPCYQAFLAKHPTQKVPQWLRKIAIYNLIFSATLSFQYKIRVVSKIQSALLFRVYVRSNAPAIARILSDIAMGGILLPGSFIGFFFRVYLNATKKEFPPMFRRFLTMLEDPPSKVDEKNLES